MNTQALKSYYINLSKDKKYPIVFGANAAYAITEQDFKGATKCLIVTNKTVETACSQLIQQISNIIPLDIHQLIIPDGEQYKTLETVSEIIDACVYHRLGRKDCLIAIGGGVLGDMVGFAAATYLRGIPFIQVPTSLLAQVDAAIGGKTGVNHPRGKNLIGAFYQPIKTIIDPTVLRTLNAAQMREGLAEIIKYGVIKDKPLFWYIEENQAAISGFRYDTCTDVWHYLIEKSIQNKATIVSADERESELREILNFGHTIGHAFEAIHHYDRISHGDAVALGMIIESRLSNQIQLLSDETMNRIIHIINQFEYTVPHAPTDKRAFFSALSLDKKVRQDLIRFVLPTDIGHTKTISTITNSQISASVNAFYEQEVI